MLSQVNRKIIALGAAAMVVLACAVGVILWLEPWASVKKLRSNDAKLVARGAAIYVKECASCHGKNLEGQPNWRTRLPNGRMAAPPHDETGHTWHHPDKLLFELTKQGPAALIGGDYKSDMIGYADTLTDEEILAVLSYIKSTWPPSIRQRHDALNKGTD